MQTRLFIAADNCALFFFNLAPTFYVFTTGTDIRQTITKVWIIALARLPVRLCVLFPVGASVAFA